MLIAGWWREGSRGCEYAYKRRCGMPGRTVLTSNLSHFTFHGIHMSHARFARARRVQSCKELRDFLDCRTWPDCFLLAPGLFVGEICRPILRSQPSVLARETIVLIVRLGLPLRSFVINAFETPSRFASSALLMPWVSIEATTCSVKSRIVFSVRNSTSSLNWSSFSLNHFPASVIFVFLFRILS